MKSWWLMITVFFMVVPSFARVRGDNLSDILANGVCETFEASPQPCDSIMVGSWSSVWTAPGYGITQEYLHAAMLQPVVQTSTTFVSTLDVIPTLTVRCARAYAALMCPTFFQPCLSVPLGDSTLAVPQSVCRSVCRQYNELCFSEAPIDCNTTNPLTGLAAWSDDTTTCTTNSLIDEPLEYPCPPPLVYVGPHETDPYTNLPCSSTCDTKIYFGTTKGKYDALFVGISVFAWVSLFSCLLVIIIYSVYPTLREYPTRLVLFAAIGVIFTCIGFVGNSVQDPEDFMCSSDGISLATDGWCRFSGWCIYFGGMVTASWWMVQAFVLFYNVALQRHKERLDKQYEWVFHIWCWGYPLVMGLVLCFAASSGGAFGSYPWCFSNATVPGMWWAMFYGVLMFYLLVVFFFISAVLARLVADGCSSTMKGRHLAPFFLSIGMFGLWYLVAIVSVIAYRAYTWQIEPQQADEISAWYACVFTTAGHWQDCPIWQQDYGWGWFLAVMIALTGFVLFLLFVPFRERTRNVISTSFSNLADGRSFFDGVTRSQGDQSSHQNHSGSGTTSSSK